ncbi:uncharacterized protein EMH_0019590 [Eimeria mitis]|uniref:Reverse transcriptase domain-containing protein n=1 Tax=Eimeria mitis TaxID=44415 RepID=U6K8E5_9EIME|nr:uncharacterized protein EMH_0019590 [Eimeria mitis]CDJ34275.1 hypothetical protein EMH_0019590 [Eimeria mitis]
MPFGLKGAPATFQANINAYLNPLLGHGVIAYLDDMLIYSNTLETHALLLQQALDIFLEHQFYPKLTKCKFGQRELTYLMFMGPKYADIARPLVELTGKNSPFLWREEHSAAVRQLKQLLSDFTTLQVPDANKPYTLYTDASGYAIGAVLEQEGKPVGFVSQVMTPTQQKYSIYDQELLELISVLDK